MLLKSNDNFQDHVLTYSYFKAGLSCISACHTACAQSFCQCSNTFQCLLSGPAGVTSHSSLKTHWVTHCYISPHTAIYPYQLTLNKALLGKKLRPPSVWMQLSPNIQLILPAQQILECCLMLEEILCICSQKLKLSNYKEGANTEKKDHIKRKTLDLCCLALGRWTLPVLVTNTINWV